MECVSRINGFKRIELNLGGVGPALVNKVLNPKCRKVAVKIGLSDAPPHINSHYYYL